MKRKVILAGLCAAALAAAPAVRSMVGPSHQP